MQGDLLLLQRAPQQQRRRGKERAVGHKAQEIEDDKVERQPDDTARA